MNKSGNKIPVKAKGQYIEGFNKGERLLHTSSNRHIILNKKSNRIKIIFREGLISYFVQ